MEKQEFNISLQASLKEAMLKRNTDLVSAIRNLISEFKYEKEKTKKDDTDILVKMAKKRTETAAIYEGKSQVLYDQEMRELEILHPFLPIELKAEEVTAFLQTLDIEKEKKNFKLFQDKCFEYFGQKVDSKLIMGHIG